MKSSGGSTVKYENGMTEKEVEDLINEYAFHLNQKSRHDRELYRRQKEPGEAFSLRSATKYRVEDALKAAEKLRKKLYPLMMQAHDLPFENAEKRINEAWEGADAAWLACTLILSESIPEPGSNSGLYQYHREAVRLAVTIDNTHARHIAERIIEAAKLAEDYSEQSINNWLSEARSEHSSSHTK